MLNSKKSKLKSVFTILIVLMPILSVYAFPGVPSLTLGEPVLIICVLLIFLSYINSSYKKTVHLYAPLYWLFVVYVIIVSLVNTILIIGYSITDTITISLRLLLYTTVIFMLAKENIEFGKLRKTYLIVCFICASYLIVQFLFGTFLNIYLPSTFSNLKIMYSDYTGATYNNFLFDTYRRLIFRPSSFFKEPSHLSRYIIYALPIIALKERRRSRFEIVSFILIFAAILITRSAMGYLGIGVFMFTWLFINRKSNSIYVKIGIFAIAICFIIASLYFGLADQAAGRLSVETGSAGARIYRGFNIYAKMPLGFKIFGSGLGNYAAFANRFNITTIYDTLGNSGNNYMNLVATTLVSSGVVGATIYMLSLIRIIWKKSTTQIACFLLFAFFAFGTNMYYYSPEYILPMLYMLFNVNAYELK